MHILNHASEPTTRRGALPLIAGLLVCTATLIPGGSSTCEGAVLATLGQSATITIDGDRSDWTGLTTYPDDSIGEAGIGPFDVDWQRLTMAHSGDQSTLFVRYQMDNGADFDSFPAFYNLYLDTDQDRDTGHIGISSQLALGADYLIQGSTVYSFSGALQTDFSWTPIGAATANNAFANLDIEMAFAMSLIGNPASFEFILFGDNALNGNTPDYYPNGGNLGAGGDVFAYTTNVPEPHTAAFMLMGFFALQIARRHGMINGRVMLKV